MRKRTLSAALAALIFCCVLLAACGKKQETPSYLGGFKYDAKIAWLENIKKDDGDYLEHREILNLQQFVTDTKLPIVICVRQKSDHAAPQVIPQMETWAYDYRGKGLFVFADANAKDPLLQHLDFTHTPMFYLVRGGVILAKAHWTETNALKLLMETFAKETEGKK